MHLRYNIRSVDSIESNTGSIGHIIYNLEN